MVHRRKIEMGLKYMKCMKRCLNSFIGTELHIKATLIMRKIGNEFIINKTENGYVEIHNSIPFVFIYVKMFYNKKEKEKLL